MSFFSRLANPTLRMAGLSQIPQRHHPSGREQQSIAQATAFYARLNHFQPSTRFNLNGLWGSLHVTLYST
jgi:hypothetical protein